MSLLSFHSCIFGNVCLGGTKLQHKSSNYSLSNRKSPNGRQQNNKHCQPRSSRQRKDEPLQGRSVSPKIRRKISLCFLSNDFCKDEPLQGRSVSPKIRRKISVFSLKQFLHTSCCVTTGLMKSAVKKIRDMQETSSAAYQEQMRLFQVGL